jgi:hypothetical protein
MSLDSTSIGGGESRGFRDFLHHSERRSGMQRCEWSIGTSFCLPGYVNSPNLSFHSSRSVHLSLSYIIEDQGLAKHIR